MPRFLVLCLLVGALAGCERPPKAAAPPAPPPPVTVAKPLTQELIDWDEFIGRLVAPEAVEVRARVSGYLQEIHFREGSDVKAGDLLFTIDPRPYQAVVDRAQADLERAQVRVELAKMEARRAKTLSESRAIAQEEIEQRNQGLADAEASLRSAQAALQTAKLDLEFTELKAPISGRISYALVTEGNLINGGANNSNATVLTTIVSLNPIHCYMDVDEQSSLKYRDLLREKKRPSALQEEIPAEMALANQTGYPHKGVIDFVDNKLDPSTGVIRARAVFPNDDQLMVPGFFARIRIPGSGKYTAFLVRDEAVGSDQGQPFLFILDEENKARQVPVTLGPMYEGLRIIKTGVQKDDRIVINGVALIRASMKTDVKEEVAMRPAAVATK